MKALGRKLTDKICVLEQYGILSREERIEYANLILLAMKPGFGAFYGSLYERLKAKTDGCPKLYLSELQAALDMFPEAVRQQ